MFVHLLVTIAQLMKPGGAKAIVAENLLMKQQLLVACRARCRAPHLSPLDRVLFGFWSLLLILEVQEVKAVPYVPLSHPFVERLIGTVRREFLDHTLFWNDTDLQRKLE